MVHFVIVKDHVSTPGLSQNYAQIKNTFENVCLGPN